MVTYHRAGEPAISDRDMLQLSRLNKGVAALFAVVSVLLLASTISEQQASRHTGSVPVMTVWWSRQRDPATSELSYVQRVATVDAHAYVGYLSFLFTLLAALDHACVGTLLRTSYERHLRAGSNPFRWAEYCLSAAAMNVMIAMLSGVLDVMLLLSVGLLTATCMAFGWAGEIAPEERTTLFAIGCVPYLGAWTLILASFLANISQASTNIPAFVYAILVVLFVVEGAFGVNQIRRTTHLRREITFILLSPTAKLLLAGITWGGIRAL